jgi:hypothetical protein
LPGRIFRGDLVAKKSHLGKWLENSGLERANNFLFEANVYQMCDSFMKSVPNLHFEAVPAQIRAHFMAQPARTCGMLLHSVWPWPRITSDT